MPTLSVSGQGTVSHAPDQATLSLSIVTNNDAAVTATSQNNATYNALRTRLAAAGVPESALHTRSYNVNFVPKPQDNAGYKPPRTGFIVTRSIDVTISDLTAVGKSIDAAVAAGVSEIGGVSYGLRERRGVYASALAAAVQDAEAQATAVAAAAHMRLGGIRSIAAGSAYVPPVVQPMMRAAAAAPAPPPTEIQPSDVDVRATVNVTYYLVP